MHNDQGSHATLKTWKVCKFRFNTFKDLKVLENHWWSLKVLENGFIMYCYIHNVY